MSPRRTQWMQVNAPGETGEAAAQCWVDLLSKQVDLGDGLYMHDTEVRVRRWGVDIDMPLTVANGRLTPKEVRVRRNAFDEDITSDTLRGIPVASMVRYGAGGIVRDLGNGQTWAAWPTPEEGAYVAENGLDDETLKIVARIYRIAFLIGDSPTKAVETVLNLSRSTAGRWVGAARTAGHLSAARGAGRAG